MQGKVRTLMIWIIIFAGALITVIPFIWMLSTSFKSEGEVFSAALRLIPQQWLWRNYVETWNSAPFGRYFFNSFLVAGVGTLGVLITSVLGGYALGRLDFPGRNGIFLAILGTMMIPTQVTMIPSFMLMRWLGWVNTFRALIVPFLVSPFGLFLMRQFFLTIPRDLEDAARIDGCSRLQTLIRIILPNAGPALASLTIFSFTALWNEFFWPLVMTTTTQMRTIQLGLAAMKSEYTIQWPLLMAATVLSTLPIFILYLTFQRFFVKGIVTTGLKG
ncbi:carbohydrate ABC transporter permease [Moorella naiadis]|uniref:carbohydrate ABC transporter permease n=1 Tax=Moorella naiadis (nom. illeg.) TaxID=3093670 RepID=UPI003D9C8547